MNYETRLRPCLPPKTAFAGFRFPAEVIVVAVRWYLRYNLSYRDVEELLVERGVGSITSPCTGGCSGSHHCWPTRPGSPAYTPGDRWFVDETYVEVDGVWRYVYRAIDQGGQVIDVLVSVRRDGATARRFFHRALTVLKVVPVEVVTDAAPIYPAVVEELFPSAWHHVKRHANNPIEADHSQLKHRLRPMRGLRTDRTAQTIIADHAFMQNLHRGHYELAGGAPPAHRVAAAFTELARAIQSNGRAAGRTRSAVPQRNGAASCAAVIASVWSVVELRRTGRTRPGSFVLLGAPSVHVS